MVSNRFERFTSFKPPAMPVVYDFHVRIQMKKKITPTTILCITVAIIVIMGMFPPWLDRDGDPMGYGYIFNPPSLRLPGRIDGWDVYRHARSIDIVRLLVQWVVVAAIGATLFYIKKQR